MQDDVTAADRQAAAEFLEAWEPGPEMTVVKLARAFAKHRLLAIRQTREQCAALADNWNPDRKDRVTETSIAYAIRAMGK